MGSGIQTRRGRGRAVVANAVTKPVNLIVPAGVLVAGFLLGWLVVLVPLAIVLYGLLVGLTLFDEGEARKVLTKARAAELPPPRELSTAGLPSQLAEPLGAAISEQRKIEDAIAYADLPYGEVAMEVGLLVDELEKIARKGALIYWYLSDPQVGSAYKRLETARQQSSDGLAADAEHMEVEALEAQVKIQGELNDQYRRCCAELGHLAASLGVIRGEIVRMTVTDEGSVQDDLADQVRDLRERVGTVHEDLSEAASQLGPAAPA